MENEIRSELNLLLDPVFQKHTGLLRLVRAPDHVALLSIDPGDRGTSPRLLEWRNGDRKVVLTLYLYWQSASLEATDGRILTESGQVTLDYVYERFAQFSWRSRHGLNPLSFTTAVPQGAPHKPSAEPYGDSGESDS